MKKIAFLLALSLAIFAFAACGKIEFVNGDNDDAKESGETEEFTAPEKVDIYEIEDILGCWYGANNGGEKYLMRVFADETAAGTYHRFTLNSYGGGEAESLFGDVYLYTDEWEEGVTSTSCTLAANVVGGNFTEEAKVGFGTFYEDGSFAYTPLYMTEPDENGAALTDIERMEADKLTFTREFDAPVLKVDREGGKISGTWFAREDDEFLMLELYKNGTFYLYQEEEMAYGTYALKDGALSLTVKEVEGEEYKGDNATVLATIDENDNIVMGEGVISAACGGVNAKYTSEAGYTLELCDDGSFYMNRADNQVAGIYTADGAGYTLYALAGGGYAKREICIAEGTGDTLSFYFMSEGADNKIIFTK